VNISAKVRKRIQVIWIDGRLVERYFAVMSEQPRNTVDSRISAMPLKDGRRAQARGGRRSSSPAKAWKYCRALRLRRAAESRQKLWKMRIGDGCKKRQMRRFHNFRKQDADMR
jgi:hypothetical protein